MLLIRLGTRKSDVRARNFVRSRLPISTIVCRWRAGLHFDDIVLLSPNVYGGVAAMRSVCSTSRKRAGGRTLAIINADNQCAISSAFAHIFAVSVLLSGRTSLVFH